MSNEENAAQVDEATYDLEEAIENEINEPSESAPEEEAPEVEPEQEETPEPDNIQKRFNKLTKEKYDAKREAEELRKRLEELESKPKEEAKKPNLEDFDYDDSSYQDALIEYRVQKAIEDKEAAQAKARQQAQAQEAQAAFNERVEKLNKPDFWDAANSIPTLDPSVAQALTLADEGAELIYHLGTHLDQADKLASMAPTQALLYIGKLSASLNKKPDVKLSAAPDPIEPINSGGSLSKDRGPDGAVFE